MRQQRGTELRALVASSDLRSWWEELQEARAALRSAGETLQKLLDEVAAAEAQAARAERSAEDALFAVEELSSRAGALEGDATAAENRAFDGVAAFEAQRLRATAAWDRLNQREQALEARRATLEQAGRLGSEERARLEAELARAERDHQAALAEYQREDAAKAERWRTVEALWARSTVLRAASAARRGAAESAKRIAEATFQQASEHKARARSLSEEAREARRAQERAREKVDALLREAEQRFACAAEDRLLVFANAERPRRVWCVALAPLAGAKGEPIAELELCEGQVTGGRLDLFRVPPAPTSRDDERGQAGAAAGAPSARLERYLAAAREAALAGQEPPAHTPPYPLRVEDLAPARPSVLGVTAGASRTEATVDGATLAPGSASPSLAAGPSPAASPSRGSPGLQAPPEPKPAVVEPAPAAKPPPPAPTARTSTRRKKRPRA